MASPPLNFFAAQVRFPRVVFEAYPVDGVSTTAGAAAGSLTFDSDFESANLRRAVQVGPREYNLVLNCDVNTRGHTQWFLYRVRGMAAGVPYRFNLINLMKPDSLFSSGMRPLLYSEAIAARDGVGWTRCGEEIAYYMNQYAYVPVPKKVAPTKRATAPTAQPARDAPLSSFYTLTFTMIFPLENDACYISQCYPFTYTMQRAAITRLLADKRSTVIRRETLCHSYGGNAVDLLTVTDFHSPPAEVAARKVVVISARVHPGESNASWMMAGLLEAITADTTEARQLRRAVVLKVVPMLNPDGVVLGNYRCSVIGVDLNRQWAEPNEVTMPTIYALKRLMKGYVANDQLLLFCDLHGHSRKRNIFAYGCESLRGPMRLRERVFPRLLADCAHFSLGGCSYKVLRSKETTGRVVVWRQFATPNSFTLEASFCGADFGPGAGSHYNIQHLKEMGAAFVPALNDFTDPQQTRVNVVIAELEAHFPCADDEGEEQDGENGGRDAQIDSGDASDRLRRAARGRQSSSGLAASKVRAVATAASVGASARRKSNVEKEKEKDATKKKKKPPGGIESTKGSAVGGFSPRNMRSPH